MKLKPKLSGSCDFYRRDGSILGFKNTWYEPAMATAEERELEPGLKILMVNAVHFCASKLEAFGDRGKNDYLGSRDLEDVVAVVDGRQELVGEIKEAQGDVPRLGESYVCNVSPV